MARDLQVLPLLLDEKNPVTAVEPEFPWQSKYTKLESEGAQAISIRANEPGGLTFDQVELVLTYFQKIIYAKP